MVPFLWTVYKTTCTINTHFYFGIHKTIDPDDSYLGSGTVLRRAVKKYGRSYFVKEVLFIFSTREEACAKEVELIASVKDDPGCYNLAKGGEAGWEYVNNSGVVQRHWGEHKEARREAIRIGVASKWADPEHYRTHVAANNRPDVKEKQRKSHRKQWELMPSEKLEAVCKSRSEQWANLPLEKQKCRVEKMQEARRLKVDKQAVVTEALNHPELSYGVLAKPFNISEVSFRRICLAAGIRRKPGTRPSTPCSSSSTF